MLNNCYIKYGFFKERLVSVEKKGIKGLSEIKDIMIGFRNKPINRLAGTEVILIQDFEKSEQLNLKTGLKSVLEFPKSNVLIFESKDGTRVAIRPSGTEPKIKFYFSVNMKLKSKKMFKISNKILEKKIDILVNEFKF